MASLCTGAADQKEIKPADAVQTAPNGLAIIEELDQVNKDGDEPGLEEISVSGGASKENLVPTDLENQIATRNTADIIMDPATAHQAHDCQRLSSDTFAAVVDQLSKHLSVS